jgi:membrane protein implicated in regulation of membrane protease activity
MNIYPIFAVIWFVVAVVWFGVVWERSDLPVLPAYFALLLCVYNLVRWWTRRRRRRPDPLQEALEARRRVHQAEERPHGPPDPNFNFTDAPPTDPPPPGPPPSAS